jgi:hypothetical protein
MAMPGTDIPGAVSNETYFKTGEKGNTWDDVVPVNEPMTFDLRKQPDKPDISLLNTLMNRACVAALEYKYNNTPVVEFVPHLRSEHIAYTNPNEIAQQGGNRSIPAPDQVDKSYWTMYVLGAYELGTDHDHHIGMPTFPCPDFANGNNQGNAYVFCETIRDVTNTHGNCPQATSPVVDYNTFFPRVVAHETLHSFLGSHGNPNDPSSAYISDQTIMNYEYLYAGWDCSLNVKQIKQIQSIDKPKPGSQIPLQQ